MVDGERKLECGSTFGMRAGAGKIWVEGADGSVTICLSVAKIIIGESTKL